MAGLKLLLADDATKLADSSTRTELATLLQASNQLRTVILRRVTGFTSRDLAPADGCRTTRLWLKNVGHLSDSAATTLVRQARVLTDIPILDRAAAGGAVSGDRIDRVVELVRRIGPEPVHAAATTLIKAAAGGSAADFKAACERVRDDADPAGQARTRRN